MNRNEIEEIEKKLLSYETEYDIAKYNDDYIKVLFETYNAAIECYPDYFGVENNLIGIKKSIKKNLYNIENNKGDLLIELDSQLMKKDIHDYNFKSPYIRLFIAKGICYKGKMPDTIYPKMNKNLLKRIELILQEETNNTLIFR